jgi:hypothetical protein
MRIIAIPDIHNRVEIAQSIINHEAQDGLQHVIFLGDYFDNWHDTHVDAYKTAIWLKKQLDAEDAIGRTFLLGNHDVPYLFPDALGKLDRCGDTFDKRMAVLDVLGTRYQHNFQISCKIGSWLLSHAGITKPLYGKYNLHEIEDELALESKVSPLLLAGMDRGGSERYGGILWCDWRSFEPVPGVNQLVGHTIGQDVRVKQLDDSINFCIDTDSKHYAVYNPELDAWTFREVSKIA